MNRLNYKKRFLYFLFFFNLIGFSNPLFSWGILTDTVNIHCSQNSDSLNCSYRTLDIRQPVSISAHNDEKELPITKNRTYPGKNATTAILFLIDTSDPARQDVIDKNKNQIEELLNLSKEHHQFGLATFDKTMRIKSPVGTSKFLLNKSLLNLNAEGLTTELYRSLLKAIGYLNTIAAQRKLILLFSDGQAEDKAYFHSDVIMAARKSKVIVNSIGYPRSISLSVSLQTLRRISEETGGTYVETDGNYNLPKSHIQHAFENIDNGGTFSIDLKDNQSEMIKLIFKIKSGSKSLSVPVNVNKDNSNTSVKESVAVQKTNKNDVAPQPSTQKITKPDQASMPQTETQSINVLLWYGLPVMLVIIVIFILIIFLLWNKAKKNTDNDPSNNDKPYAYLIADDGTDLRYPITRTIWRIGRDKNNELTIDDTSVSRRHAEIHRNNDGTFHIIDMNSKNGLYINDKKLDKAILEEADVIEIGDIVLNFTQFSYEYSAEEKTVMQKTKVPII